MDRVVRLGVLSGFLSPIIAFIGIAYAISGSPWFNWWKNAISDLGVRSPNPLVFNMGLMMAGLLIMVFAFGHYRALSSVSLNRLVSAVILLTGIFLFSIGLFPESAGRIHYYVSVAFFVLLMISMLLSGIMMILGLGRYGPGLLALVLGVMASSIWTLRWEGVAIPELFSTSIGALWLWMLCVGIYTGKLTKRRLTECNQKR
jgi:hypothetical membrane protein